VADQNRPERAQAGARWLTNIYATATVIATATWLLGRWGARQPNWLELAITLLNIPLARTPASAVLLAITTWALWVRKRVGLVAVAVYQVVGMYLGVSLILPWPTGAFLRPWRREYTLTNWLDVVSVPVGAAILWWLWTLRPAFQARLRRGSWLGAGLVAVAGSALTVGVIYALAKTLSPAGSGGWPEVGEIFAHLSGIAVGPDPALAVLPEWVPDVASALLAVTLLAIVAVVLRTATDPTEWSGERELRIRALLKEFGSRDSLAYFATRRDKSSVFSPDGRAVITYRVVAGVALASGDPIGDPDAWPAAIQEWISQARHYGWLPAVLAASKQGARAYARTGLRVLLLGDEAVLDSARFSLSGTEAVGVRKAVQHARREGLRVEISRQEDLKPEQLEQLYAAARQWRKGATERGFSMALNREGDPADGRIAFVQARDPNGNLAGLLSLVPWGTSGLSLDIMRHGPSAPHGTTELMVAELMARAPRLGIRRVSLNFCMFRQVFAQAEEFGNTSVAGRRRSVLGLLDRFWQLERLYQATRRYQPDWVPRVLCFDDRLSLPQVAAAVGTAEGFLPRLGPRDTGTRRMLGPAEVAELHALDGTPTPPQVSSRTHEFDRRLAHSRTLRALGFGPTRPAERCEADVTAGDEHLVIGEHIRLDGRVRVVRDHGGVVFVELAAPAAPIQLLFDAGALGRDQLDVFRHNVDKGDLMDVHGVVGASRNGTRSLLVQGWRVEAKALHPIPFPRRTGEEKALRSRTLDLIVHPDHARVLRTRARVLAAVRELLDQRGYLEVETPVLQPLHGGAAARPFLTRSNAYGEDVYLRIAPELYLKRLVVAGMGKVYEIGRDFRNEGADGTHNPEFTALEAYEPGGDYRTMQTLTQDLVVRAAAAAHPPDSVQARLVGAGRDAITDPWPVVPVLRALSQAVGEPVGLDTPIDRLLHLGARHGLAVPGRPEPGALIEALYGHLVEATTTTPTFYVDFPKSTSPLVATHRDGGGLVERWDLVVDGLELATGYSELVDPIDQRERLTRQSLLAAGGDLEAMELDEDFLTALELGMPPTGGLGIGIDRLLMLLTGLSIRSVLAFPYQSRGSGSPLSPGFR